MEIFAGNVSTATGKNRMVYNPEDDMCKKEPSTVRHAHNSDNNLQLVHLLTTNPAAALPAFFPANRNAQKVFARQSLHMTRPRTGNGSTSWRGDTKNSAIHELDQLHANSWTASLMSEKIPFRRKRSFSELYVSKEDIDKKACCIDKNGYFDFEVLLPAVYWKPDQ